MMKINELKRKIDNEMKAIILDLDGTVFDSMWVWSEIDRRFLAERGFDVPVDYLKDIAPLGARKAAEYTIKRFNLNEQPQDLIDEWFEMAIAAYENEVECKSFVKEYIKMAKCAGKLLAVATSSDRLLVVPALKRTGIFDYFDTIVTVEDVKRGKGFPDIYEKAAGNMGVPNEKCVVFEDILAGIKGAKAGGFMAVGVHDEHSANEHDEMKKIADGFIMGFGDI